MPRANIKYIDVAELLLNKQREHERLEQYHKDECDASLELVAWLVAFGVAVTGVILLVAYQEGWF